MIERLARRDVVQCRRRLVDGLGRMFRFLRRRELTAGSGFWVAPQHWFVLGLSRDEEEPRFDPLVDTILFGSMGPSFERAIDWPARRHLLDVLRGMEVDLVFVEDGVRFPALRRVLRILFELHDTWGGGRRLEERFLQGIPGLRAVLHDFDLEHPFESSRYPEPDYEDVGRARVLHLFRDRGEDEERVEAPSSDDRVLVGV